MKSLAVAPSELPLIRCAVPPLRPPTKPCVIVPVEPPDTTAQPSGAAAAPARAPLTIQIPDFTEDDNAPELPWPGEAASEEELLAYANSKRTIKLLKRVFRARVTGVAAKTELP